MTYEQHGSGGYPASPDIDLGLPVICEKCDRDCPEPCEAFKRLEIVKMAIHKVIDPLKEQKKPLNVSQIVIYSVVGALSEIADSQDSTESTT